MVRRFGFMMVLLSLFWSCEFWPEPVATVEYRASTQLILATGDTTVVEFGRDLASISLTSGDSTILEILDMTDSEMTLVALAEGETRIELEGMSQGQVSELSYNIKVQTGQHLTVYVDEDQGLNLSDYFSAAALADVDSVSITGADDAYLAVSLSNNYMTMWRGLWPHDLMVTVSMYSAADEFLESVIFNVEIRVRKVVLAEIFTNSGCVNCPQANHAMDNLVDQYNEGLATIRYHVSWTDPNDPMNLANPGDSHDRVMYYGVYLAPWVMFDSETMGNIDEGLWSASISQHLNEASPILIRTEDVNLLGDSLLEISYQVIPTEPGLSDNYSSYAVVTEDSIEYAGPNGETIHMQVMRDLEMVGGLDLSMEHSIVDTLVKPTAYAENSLFNFVFFLQNENTGLVEQALTLNAADLE